MHAVVPDVELGRPGVAAHPVPVGLDGGTDGGPGPALAGCRRSWPATTRLAASRWTSHSNGPGSVSSKSRRSKARLRSGVAHRPKLRTWASPHSWTSMPAVGSRAEVGGHDRRRPPVVVPRGDGHPLVAERDQRRVAHARSGRGSSPGRRGRGRLPTTDRGPGGGPGRGPTLPLARRSAAVASRSWRGSGYVAGDAAILRPARTSSRRVRRMARGPGHRSSLWDPTRRSLSGLRVMRMAVTIPSATEHDRTWSMAPSTSTRSRRRR